MTVSTAKTVVTNLSIKQIKSLNVHVRAHLDSSRVVRESDSMIMSVIFEFEELEEVRYRNYLMSTAEEMRNKLQSTVALDQHVSDMRQRSRTHGIQPWNKH